MISGKTKTYAILGDPIEQALSPVVHNAAYQTLGMDAVMVGCRVSEAELEAAMAGVRAMHFSGLAVTMPLKAAVIPLLDGCDDMIRSLGAVNVVTCEDGRYIGYNTDGDGFLYNMKEQGVEPSGKHVLVYGAGGASRGICYALLADGVSKLTICNGSRQRAEDMIRTLSERFSTEMEYLPLDSELIPQRCREAQIIINTTSMGMNGSLSPHVDQIPWDELPKTTVFADIIHKPIETAFIKRARAAGFQALTGDGMMLYQAVLAFRLLTGVDAPVAVMKQAIQSKLEEENR